MGQFASGAGESALDGAGGQAQDGGDFFVAEVVEVAEQDDLAEALGQVPDGLADDAVVLVPACRWGRRFRQLVGQTAAAALASQSASDVAADAGEPGAYAVGLSEAAQVAAGDGEGLLGGVFGEVPVGQGGVGQGDQGAVVAFVELREG